jgi:hypothetical protein
MSLEEELLKLDPKKVEETLDDLLGPEVLPDGIELNQDFFSLELARAKEKYPFFHVMPDRIRELVAELEAGGVSEEQVRGVYRGILLAQLVLSTCADTESLGNI